jgi:hypothetical protein
MGWGGAALAYAVATLSVAWPALGGAFLINPRSDQYLAGYAFREFAASSLRAGNGFPQWNPFLQGALPYIAAMHGDIFYPTFLLRMVMPTDAAMTWEFAIHLFLAGLFTFGFLRACNVGFFGALVGGLAYMMSGPIAAYASPGHDGKLFVSALLPLALWMIVRGVGQGRAYAWGVLALTVGLAVLSPHPQLLQYMLLVTGAFALYLAFATHEQTFVYATSRDYRATEAKLPPRVAVSRLAHALVAVVIGALMGAVQYLPVREYVSWSPRSGGKGWEHAVSYSLPTEELFNTIVPQFSGMLENYWGRNLIHLHSEYPGIVTLMLAGAGLFAVNARRNFRWFWGGTFVISLLWALGGSTPFYHIVYAIVPGTKFFRAPSTMMFVTMFSIAVFAALGVERLVTAARSVSRTYIYGWAAAMVVIAILMAGGLPTTIAESVTSMFQADTAAMLMDQARNNQPNVVLGALRSTVFALATLALVWLAANRWEARRTLIGWTLAALVVLDLWTIERHYWIFSQPARVLFASDPAIDAMRNAAEPGRAFAWDPIRLASYRDPAFQGDAFMVHRVRSVMGYHGNELSRYQQLLEQAQATGTIVRPRFWEHENVHYLYTTLPDSMIRTVETQLRMSQPFTHVVGPVRNAAGSIVYLYRMPGRNPAAWVATAIVKGSDDQALATILDERFEPSRAAIFDTAAAVQVQSLTTPPAPAGVQARVTRMEPGQIDVQLTGDAPAGAALVVSENYFPGWRATVDGKDANTARANFNLIGVPLPAGARNVQLRFVDPAYGTGKTLTLVAFVLTLAAIIGGVVLDRRPRTESVA